MWNILLVDDTPASLTLNKHLLRVIGCNVTTSSCPLEALKLLERDNPFDAIITDIRMPKMNGVEFFHAVKALHPRATVIFASVCSQTEWKHVIPAQVAAYSLFGGYYTVNRFKSALENAMGGGFHASV